MPVGFTYLKTRVNQMITEQKKVKKGLLKYNDITVLTFITEYPQFFSQNYLLSIKKVNEFYKNKADEFADYCRNVLYKSITSLYDTLLEQGLFDHDFNASLTYKTTYLSECNISLYSDQNEYLGGAHGKTKRDSQTWNLQKGDRLYIDDLYKCNNNSREYILNIIEERIKAGKEQYFPNSEELLTRKYQTENFYCTPDKLVVYFQPLEIAPLAGGIKEFYFSYNGCIKSPESTCFKI